MAEIFTYLESPSGNLRLLWARVSHQRIRTTGLNDILPTQQDADDGFGLRRGFVDVECTEINPKI